MSDADDATIECVGVPLEGFKPVAGSPGEHGALGAERRSAGGEGVQLRRRRARARQQGQHS